MISLVKKDYDSTKIYRKTHKKGASQTYDTPSFFLSTYNFTCNKVPAYFWSSTLLCKESGLMLR